MLNMALHNAHVLYRKCGGNLIHLRFHETLVEDILQEHYKGPTKTEKKSP